MNTGRGMDGYLHRFAYRPRQPLQFTTGHQASQSRSQDARTANLIEPRSEGWEELDMYANYREEEQDRLDESCNVPMWLL